MRQIPYSILLFSATLLACGQLTWAYAQSDPVVFETRPAGHTGGGVGLNDGSFPGHTFRLHERTEISAIGVGNLRSWTGSSEGDTVFAALYRVDTADTIPDVVGESGLLDVALMELSTSPTDTTGAVSLVVEPGIYAIVVGTGRHGATAGSALLENAGTDAGPDTWSHPYSLNPVTGNRTLQGVTVRFFLEGQTLPPLEPPATEFLMETALPTAWWSRSSHGLSDSGWRGTRFEVTRPVKVDQAGIWLHSGSGQLFAAIVELSGPGANPPNISHPAFDDAVAGVALIDPGGPPQAYSGAFEDVTLQPGHYALVFGSGKFGATGQAHVMGIADQILVPGSLTWAGSHWTDFSTTFRLFLTGFLPEISVTPDPADFGDVPLGHTGETTITISNLREDSPLQLGGIGVGAGGFGLGPDVSQCSTATLNPGEDCQFTLLFTPDGTGETISSLQVTSDGEPSPFWIDLIGNGTEPELSLDPSIHDFGEVETGTSSTQLVVTLHNTGDADATGMGFSLDGAPGFSLPDGDCSSVLPAGQSCQFSVEFNPVATGPAATTVTWSGNESAAHAELELTGTGTAAMIGIKPASLSFEVIVGQIGADTLSISNDGDIELNWSITTESECDGGAGGEWLSTSPPQGTTAPGGSTDIQVFASAAELGAGQHDAVLCIHSNALGASELEVPIELTVTSPVLIYDPTSLAFGDAQVGDASGPITAMLENIGDADATGLDFSGASDAFQIDTGDCDDTLPAGHSCTVSATFAPGSTGPFQSEVVVESIEGSTASLELSGTGTQPELQVMPGLLEFGDIPVGETSDPQTLALTSTGSAPVTVNEIIGPDASFEAAGGDCGAPPFTLIPDESCTLGFTFTPAETGEATGAVTIISNAPSSPGEAGLVGNGVAPILGFDPSGLDFGDVETGDEGVTLIAVLQNTGDSGATGLDFLIPAGFSADTAGCGDDLPAGENCEIAVTFAPTQTGTVEDLLVASGAQGAVAELTLSGHGIQPGALGVDPEQVHFDNVPVSTTRMGGFTVVNTGGADIEISAVVLESGGPEFAIHHNDCPPGIVLEPEEGCVVEIAFAPQEIAPVKGTVSITSGDQQVEVTLSGTGVGDEIFHDRFQQP